MVKYSCSLDGNKPNGAVVRESLSLLYYCSGADAAGNPMTAAGYRHNSFGF